MESHQTVVAKAVSKALDRDLGEFVPYTSIVIQPLTGGSGFDFEAHGRTFQVIGRVMCSPQSPEAWVWPVLKESYSNGCGRTYYGYWIKVDVMPFKAATLRVL